MSVLVKSFNSSAWMTKMHTVEVNCHVGLTTQTAGKKARCEELNPGLPRSKQAY